MERARKRMAEMYQGDSVRMPIVMAQLNAGLRRMGAVARLVGHPYCGHAVGHWAVVLKISVIGAAVAALRGPFRP